MLTVPQPLYSLINSTYLRGQELLAHDPIVSYYCQLHAIQTALSTNLHQTDPQVSAFISSALDDIESFKSGLTDAVRTQIDNAQESKAHVWKFANKVLDSADNELKEGRCSLKSTVPKFLAAATFLDVMNVFKLDSERDKEEKAELAIKTKYAKYQAMRITKKVRAGEDPNELGTDDLIAQLQAEDEEPKDSTESHTSSIPPPATDDIALPPPVSLPPPTSSSSSVPAPAPAPASSSARSWSPPAPSIPSAPSNFPTGSYSSSTSTSNNNNNDNFSSNYTSSRASSTSIPAPIQQQQQQHHAPISKSEVQTILSESEIYTQSQKHAKFAISALNYEDVTTAINELETALKMLKGLDK